MRRKRLLPTKADRGQGHDVPGRPGRTAGLVSISLWAWAMSASGDFLRLLYIFSTKWHPDFLIERTEEHACIASCSCSPAVFLGARSRWAEIHNVSNCRIEDTGLTFRFAGGARRAVDSLHLTSAAGFSHRTLLRNPLNAQGHLVLPVVRTSLASRSCLCS
jgi:hypothetical protein